jgi:hypothetical protein
MSLGHIQSVHLRGDPGLGPEGRHPSGPSAGKPGHRLPGSSFGDPQGDLRP